MQRLGLVLLACGVVWNGPGPEAAARQSADRPLTFELQDTTGKTYDRHAWHAATAVLLFFVTPDCPVSQGYVPEMNRIGRAYASRGVVAYGVQSDRAATKAAIRRHVEDFGSHFPVLLDWQHHLVEHVDATATPEAAVLTPAGRVLYTGRIDDRIPALGVRRPRATVYDLREALDAILAGRPVGLRGPSAVGCYISRRS
jgi:peroxiredoxin